MACKPPTLKAVRSNRIGRTKGNPPFYKGWRVFTFVYSSVQHTFFDIF